jgi:hypothetical protein
MKPDAALLLLVALGTLGPALGSVVAVQPSPAGTGPSVAYPEGYRDWVHIKSSLITPTHARLGANSGFQHIYANAEGMTGYRTGDFPDGSVVVFDWLEMTEKDGAYAEGPRRQVDVMVKGSRRFAATGGWGFQRFVKDSRTEHAARPTPLECFACHDRLKQRGLILSSYRP